MEDFSCQSNCKVRDKREYRDSSKRELLGVYCRNCQQEWLLQKFVYPEQISSCEKVLFQTKEEDITFYKVNKIKLPVDPAFQMQSTRDVYENDSDLIKTLKVGDHIAWERWYVIHHHAIIVAIDERNKNLVTVMQWGKDKNNTDEDKSKCTIFKEKIDLNKQKDKLARINYARDITEKNPAELVRARAYSRICDTGYRPFSDNCESYATYCKTGVAQSHQVHWLIAKLKDFAKSIPGFLPKLAGKVNWPSVFSGLARFIGAETAEVIGTFFKKLPVTAPNVAAGVILCFELYYCGRDITRVYKKYSNGDITGYDGFITILKRAIEFLFTAGLAIAGSFIPGFIPGIIGGFVGMVLGKLVAKIVGYIVEKLARLAKCIFGKVKNFVQSTASKEFADQAESQDSNHTSHLDNLVVIRNHKGDCNCITGPVDGLVCP